MVDTGIFATTAEVQRKVGIGANATYNAEAYINQYMTEAESYINAYTRYNWSDAYAALNVDVKGILKMVASEIAATKVINADLSGFPSTLAIQTRLDVMDRWIVQCLKVLEKHKKGRFIQGE